MTMASGSRNESQRNQARVFHLVLTLWTSGSALRSSQSKRGTPEKPPSSKRCGTKLTRRGSFSIGPSAFAQHAQPEPVRQKRPIWALNRARQGTEQCKRSQHQTRLDRQPSRSRPAHHRLEPPCRKRGQASQGEHAQEAEQRKNLTERELGRDCNAHAIVGYRRDEGDCRTHGW